MRTLDADEQARLEDVLALDPPGEASIFDVVGKMDALLTFFEDSEEFGSLAPFLRAYYRVTEEVVRHRTEDAGFFDDPAALERLDVRFARLYFEPLRAYLFEGEKREPWRTYLSYCEREDSRPVLEMSLGINAHINADLVQVLIEEGYDEREDYEQINTILSSVFKELLEYLAFSKHDAIGLEALVLRKTVSRLFARAIVRWREEAWDHAAERESFDSIREEIHAETEHLAADLIDITEDFSLLHIPHTIHRIGDTSVRLDGEV